MIQEQKELLMKDLCARLPYEVHGMIGAYNDCIIYPHDITDLAKDLREIKPYLRPMSSMTEEEKKGLFKAIDKDMHLLEATLDKKPLFRYCDNLYYGNPIHYELDFLISHHFDYLGLIPKGLALEATEDMYKN